jgi:O-antigen/teichoic acid export membrane protein
VFESIFFIDFWIYGFASICLFELLAPFITISFGAQYVLPVDVTFILCLNFYLTGIRQAVLSFRDSLGLFWHDRYKSIAESVLNLGASVLLAFWFGISGIFWGTLISTVLISLWAEPYILYKHQMHKSLLRYFGKLGVYTGAVFLCGIITHVICSHVEGDAVRQFLLKIPLCLTVPNCLIWLFFHRTAEYRHLLGKIRLFLRR